ncbi:MAG: hypothetical protein PSU94_01350 [Lacunisphaera sp.]|nr:hypothetical protein [Lacunisphaera sp.]
MDESLQQLEDELKSLRLRGPSPQLVDRLTTELTAETDGLAAPVRRYTTASTLRSWQWLGWRAAGLAAALALGAGVAFVAFKSQPAAPPSSQVAVTNPAPVNPEVAAPATRDEFRPVAATNVLYDLKDEGLVNVEGGAPARQVRARYLDTYTWTNSRHNSSLKWSVPRDEVRVLPASLH